MAEDLAWVSVSARQPQDSQLVYARSKSGKPQKVTFHVGPTPRWEGANIVYDLKYFAEWAALDSERKPPARSR